MSALHTAFESLFGLWRAGPSTTEDCRHQCPGWSTGMVEIREDEGLELNQLIYYLQQSDGNTAHTRLTPMLSELQMR